jgi:hypothetical protein
MVRLIEESAPQMLKYSWKGSADPSAIGMDISARTEHGTREVKSGVPLAIALLAWIAIEQVPQPAFR